MRFLGDLVPFKYFLTFWHKLCKTYIFLREYFLEKKFLTFFLSEISANPRNFIPKKGHFWKKMVFVRNRPDFKGHDGRFWPIIQNWLVRTYIFHQKNFELRNFCISRKIRILAKYPKKWAKNPKFWDFFFLKGFTVVFENIIFQNQNIAYTAKYYMAFCLKFFFGKKKYYLLSFQKKVFLVNNFLIQKVQPS